MTIICRPDLMLVVPFNLEQNVFCNICLEYLAAMSDMTIANCTVKYILHITGFFLLCNN